MSNEQSDKKTNQGYIYLHRKVRQDWKWKNAKYRSAWTWMLVEAAGQDGYKGLKRGQLWFSVSWAPKVWGMSTASARRFLHECVKDMSIMWTKGQPGGVITSRHDPTDDPTDDPTLLGSDDPTLKRPGGASPGLITILNYEKYQTPPDHDDPTLKEGDDPTLNDPRDPTDDPTHDHIRNTVLNTVHKKEEYRGTIENATKKLSTDLSTDEATDLKNENQPDVLKADIEILIAHFKKDHDDLCKDEEPAIINPESATVEFKRLFEAGYDYEEIKRRMDQYIRDDLKWIGFPPHTIEAFTEHFSRYAKHDDIPTPEPEDNTSTQDQRLDSAIDQLPEDEKQKIYEEAESQALQSNMRIFKDNPQAWSGAIQDRARIIYQERYQ